MLYSGTQDGMQTSISCHVSDRTGRIGIRAAKFWKSHGWKGGAATNPDCPVFLGCVIAERVLSKVFKNVKTMPTGNKGFDFICGKGFKIDVKSSCFMKHRPNQWRFRIRQNKIADYFLCLAFDNRDDLIPQRIWLFPSANVSQMESVTISKNVLGRFAEHELEIGKIIVCCDAMRHRKRTANAMASAKQIVVVVGEVE